MAPGRVGGECSTSERGKASGLTHSGQSAILVFVKHPTSFYLSEDAHRIIGELADRTGVSRASVVETAIRVYQEVLDVAVQRVSEGRPGDGDASPGQGGRPPKSA